MKKLVIFGSGEIGELANYYFSRDSDYEVVASTLDAEFVKESSFCGLPVIPFQDLCNVHPPEESELFLAIGYSHINALRRAKYQAAKEMGYKLASYVSSRATVLNDGMIGDNCFIFEDNTIQPFVSIGNNVTLWSGNHVGHHSIINDHCFIASHVVISGGVTIGEQSFLGVNCTIRNHISIGARCVIGAGALILGDVEADGVYIGKRTERADFPSSQLKKI